MRNELLANLDWTERAYPWVTRLPKSARRLLARRVPKALGRALAGRGVPDRLTLFITDDCNLRCPHCFIITDHQEKASWTMGLPECEQLFRSVRGQVSRLLLTGGEPTLREDLGPIMAAAANEGRIPQVGIFTHGLQRQRVLKAVEHALEHSKARLNFQVSVDGAREFHDSNRGVPGGLSKTLETMEALNAQAERFPKRFGRLAVCTAISAKNIDTLPDIIEAVRPTGFLHAFTFVRGAEVWNLKDQSALSAFTPSTGFEDYLTPEQMRQALRTLDQHLWSRHRNSLYYATNRVTLETIAYMQQREKPLAACQSGKADLTILPNGDVARCENLRPVDNLARHDWSLPKLLEGNAFQEGYAKTRGCFCTQDCALNVSAMYSPVLLEELFAPVNGKPKTTGPFAVAAE